MTSGDAAEARTPPTRREPPRFRRVEVRRVTDLSARMRRVVLGGDELDGLEIGLPAASVRLLLPAAVGDDLVMPTWSGNQFDLPDGRRAPIRTFTPRRLDAAAAELTLDVVRHGNGAAAAWVDAVEPGAEAAISGPGRGYEIDTNAASYLLVGDETAIPAISQLLEALPDEMPVEVHLEIADPGARPPMPAHPAAQVRWHAQPEGGEPGAAMVEAVEGLAEAPDGVWVAGEAAAVQRLRKHLFEGRGLSRSEATVRGYWKKGRSAT